MDKEMDPAVERRYGYPPMFAVFRYCAGTFQISGKNSDHKSQGVRTKRYEYIRKNGMRMSAGIADISGDGNYGIMTVTIMNGYH